MDRFRAHPEISELEAYRLMVRLLDEQCEVEEGQTPKVKLKNPEDIPGDSLQSPSNPDATYGHKGKGYKASLTETCSEGNAFQAITDVWVDGAHVSDQTDVPKVIDRLEEAGAKPQELFADSGYGRGENIVACREEGIEATVSEADRVTGLKNVWCRGLDRVRTAVTFKALAIHIKKYISSELERAARAKAGGAHGLHMAIFGVLARIRGLCRGHALAHACDPGPPGEIGSFAIRGSYDDGIKNACNEWISCLFHPIYCSN